MEYRVLDIREKTEAEYCKAYSRLPKYRQLRADKFRRISDRYCCVFAYDLLLDMLSETTGLKREELIIKTDPKGKPYLENASLEFSLSHTEGFVACAVDGKPIGIDIETPREISGKILRSVLSESELFYVLNGDKSEGENAPPNSEISKRFLRIWTAKEAYLKCIGEGLSGLGRAKVNVENHALSIAHGNHCLLSECKNEYFLAIVKAGSG